MIKSWLLLFILIACSHATSVRPELQECPVCAGKSVAIRLMSYSNFGEPARDLSDHPRFSFSEVETCPHDLFAGYPDAWKEMKPQERDKLREFLKTPALRLTSAEKRIIAGHEEQFRESGFFPMLWARSCDDFLTLGLRARFHRVLRLHYRGSRISTWKDAREREKRLATYYRAQAIDALKDARSADWPSSRDKRVFDYLRAEFMRQAGRDDEAYTLFQQVIATESRLKDSDEETSWILTWAQEQSLRSSPDAKNADKLIVHILPELPDPWRDDKATETPRWPLHYAALDLLVERASLGDKAFSEALWKLLDRKPERLLALLETSGSSLSPVRAADPRWAAWFDEIKNLLDRRKLPSPLDKDKNQERVRNVLWSAVNNCTDDDNPDPWFVEVLLPAVRKSVSSGGLPSLSISEKHLYPGLSLSMLDNDTSPDAAASLNDLGRALYKLWEQLPDGKRSDVARIYVRILHKLGDDFEDSFDYPVEYFLPGLAATQEGRDAIRAEFDGPWKSTFWKAACAYAARMENSGKTLCNHPLLAKWGYGLAAKLFQEQKDPSMKELAMKKLREDEYVIDEIFKYLNSLDLPETRDALEEFAEKTRNASGDRAEGRLHTLQNLDEARINAGLKRIPLR